MSCSVLGRRFLLNRLLRLGFLGVIFDLGLILLLLGGASDLLMGLLGFLAGARAFGLDLLLWLSMRALLGLLAHLVELLVHWLLRSFWLHLLIGCHWGLGRLLSHVLVLVLLLADFIDFIMDLLDRRAHHCIGGGFGLVRLRPATTGRRLGGQLRGELAIRRVRSWLLAALVHLHGRFHGSIHWLLDLGLLDLWLGVGGSHLLWILYLVHHHPFGRVHRVRNLRLVRGL